MNAPRLPTRIPTNLIAKILEIIRETHQEFELILKTTSFLTDYLSVDKVNFLFSGKEEKAGLVAGAWQILKEGGSVHLSDTSREELKVAGDLLRMALENITLRRQIAVDPLTKLYNRAAFNKELEFEAEKSKRYKDTFSLLMIDIDRLALLNDKYGREAGDAILQIVAKTLTKITRSADRVYRLEGSRFALIVANTDEKGATQLGQRLKKNVEAAVPISERLKEALKKSSLGMDAKKITINVGMGSCTYSGREKEVTPVELITRADEALFKAKEEPRDFSKLSTDLENPSLLIVDDEEEYCQVLADYFRQKGYEVTAVTSGEAALETLKNKEFHAMILDIRMPGISGIDVLEKIPRLVKRMKIVVLSAAQEEAIKKLTYAYGVCDYLEKPVSIEYLSKSLMTRILEMKSK